jgi:hypothetical protein
MRWEACGKNMGYEKGRTGARERNTYRAVNRGKYDNIQQRDAKIKKIGKNVCSWRGLQREKENKASGREGKMEWMKKMMEGLNGGSRGQEGNLYR